MNSGRGALAVNKNVLGRSSLLLYHAARRFAGGAVHRGIRDISLVFGDVYRYAISLVLFFRRWVVVMHQLLKRSLRSLE